ncbi:hypothetical protein GCM10010339_57530 [Streptomyces alanosinicus]|uniref:MFS transporter n=1 Tax=Streptomyces alanosinicus TaxID=68171 RepID=A0A918YMW9_9ACTN|nr:hypothetical protein GCM10010339_57530 [Streptomyces alanosinicus]
MVAAGPIVSTLDYRRLFWIPVAIVVATVLIAVAYVPESPNRAQGKVSWYGAGLLSAWLIDLRVMRLPAAWTTSVAALLFGAGMYAIWSFLPGFVQTPVTAGYGFGASVTASGLLAVLCLAAPGAALLVPARRQGRTPTPAAASATRAPARVR